MNQEEKKPSKAEYLITELYWKIKEGADIRYVEDALHNYLQEEAGKALEALKKR